MGLILYANKKVRAEIKQEDKQFTLAQTLKPASLAVMKTLAK